jgi:hypothetical protein
MRRLLMMLGAALILAQPIHAQMSAPIPELHGNPVTLVTISGIVHPNPADQPPLPFDVLARIERDPHLARMETESRAQTGPVLELVFAFPSVEAYRAWSASAETRQLMADLRGRVSQLELAVSLRRTSGLEPASSDN